MTKPLISVIIPAYNSGEFIAHAINSVLNQTFQNFEIIVVDDGSIDNTVNIIEELAINEKRICLVKQNHLGLAATRNKGIEFSKADLLAFLDSDDLWHKDKLFLQIKYLKRFPEAGFVSCLSRVIDKSGEFTGLSCGDVLNGGVYKKVLERNGVSNGSTVLIKKKCFDLTGTFDTSLKYCEDWDMWIRLSRFFPLVTINKTLVGYRRCKNAMTRNYDELSKFGEIVLEKNFKLDKDLTSYYFNYCLARQKLTVATICVLDWGFDEAWKYLSQAIRRNIFAVFADWKKIALLFIIVLSRFIPEKIYKFVLWRTLSIKKNCFKKVFA